MLSELTIDERMRLVHFVCSFAWADLSVSEEERSYVRRLLARLDLPADEQPTLDQLLATAPSPEEVDPDLIPDEHRELFLDTIRGVIASDLQVSPEERDAMRILQELLRSRR